MIGIEHVIDKINSEITDKMNKKLKYLFLSSLDLQLSFVLRNNSNFDVKKFLDTLSYCVDKSVNHASAHIGTHAEEVSRYSECLLRMNMFSALAETEDQMHEMRSSLKQQVMDTVLQGDYSNMDMIHFVFGLIDPYFDQLDRITERVMGHKSPLMMVYIAEEIVPFALQNCVIITS